MFGEEESQDGSDDTPETSTDNYISSLAFDPKVTPTQASYSHSCRENSSLLATIVGKW